MQTAMVRWLNLRCRQAWLGLRPSPEHPPMPASRSVTALRSKACAHHAACFCGLAARAIFWVCPNGRKCGLAHRSTVMWHRGRSDLVMLSRHCPSPHLQGLYRILQDYQGVDRQLTTHSMTAK